MNPVDLISALPWRRAIFTTYSLSLSFFEAVVLDALVRGGGKEALILSDVAGVRAALMEQGARRAGRDYLVEPIAVQNGVFHPKISALVAEDDCHLMVGSGNLTFGGWGGNFEVCEHLHPSFAPDAFMDASEFFEYLSVSDGRFRHGAAAPCSVMAEELRAAVRGRALTGDVRLLHNLDEAISQKLLRLVDDLGGAKQIVVAAPFWDGGIAVDRLCKTMGLAEVFVHSHAGGTVEGRAGANWPSRCASKVRAVQLDALTEEKRRRLHAKVFEVVCRRGRIVMSGSANATQAALGAGHNVEACIVRIQREKTAGWSFSPAAPPPPNPENNDTVDAEEIEVGVLRAELDVDDHIVGQILTPQMSGPAAVFRIVSGVQIPLGNVELGEEGHFKIAAPGLELEAWKGGRLAIRVQSLDGRRAEGFLSMGAFAGVSRRLGAMAARLMAIIAGTETPADVAAIFSWFNEDPRRLGSAADVSMGGGFAGKPETAEDRTIPVAALAPEFVISSPVESGSNFAEGVGWKRFMDHVFSAFREPREPFACRRDDAPGEDEEDDDSVASGDITAPDDPAVDHSLRVFESLFELMLSAENESKHAITAYELTRYVCDRLNPEAAKVKKWLGGLVDAMSRMKCPSERSEEFAAVVLLLLSAGQQDRPSLRKARARIIRIGFDMSGPAPSKTLVNSLEQIIAPGARFDALWAEVQEILTFGEQVVAYLDALSSSTPSAGYPDFETEARKEWQVLRDAIVSENAKRRLLILEKQQDACPKCYMVLPADEKRKLQSVHVATCTSCGRIIICRS